MVKYTNEQLGKDIVDKYMEGARYSGSTFLARQALLRFGRDIAACGPNIADLYRRDRNLIKLRDKKVRGPKNLNMLEIFLAKKLKTPIEKPSREVCMKRFGNNAYVYLKKNASWGS